jgi:hypothetical protein
MLDFPQAVAAAGTTLPVARLRASNSLIEALDMFKQTRRATLPVYQRERFLGNLAKEQLLKAITQVLGETEARG